MGISIQEQTAKEILWLSCRAKTCCHTTKVVISGKDMWRISRTLEVMPWDFTLYWEATDNAVGAFRLAPGGVNYQVILAKRGEAGEHAKPCIFLWKLNDGHAQCGLGTLRPLACQTYPAVLVNGLLYADSSPCTCHRWSVSDLDGDTDKDRLRQMLEEAHEYDRIVDKWNTSLEETRRKRTYREFCAFVIGEYERMSERASE